jgi:putative transposase
MQVFGLPGHVIRNGRAASRLIAAKPPSSAAAIRREALERWRLLMGRGLSAAVAAKGRRDRPGDAVSLAEAHRAEEPATASGPLPDVDGRARADGRAAARRSSDVGQAQDHRAAAPTRDRRLGLDRRAHLTMLMERGRVSPVPMLRRKPGGRRFRLIGERHARRLPKGLKPTRPGELVQSTPCL